MRSAMVLYQPDYVYFVSLSDYRNCTASTAWLLTGYFLICEHDVSLIRKTNLQNLK